VLKKLPQHLRDHKPVLDVDEAAENVGFGRAAAVILFSRIMVAGTSCQFIGAIRAMRGIKVNTVGITSHMRTGTPSRSAPLSTTPTSLTIEQLAPNTALLIDRYEPMIDGDFITFYNAAFIDQQDQKQLIRAAIGPSGPSAKFVAMVA
jgi:hypothetical protein